MVVVAWADARLASSRVCCCLPSGWRRVCLQLDGRRLRCGAHPLLLLPSSQAAPISSEEARRPEPHAWTVHTPRPPRGSWLLRLCVHPTVWLLAAENEAERELWLREVLAPLTPSLPASLPAAPPSPPSRSSLLPRPSRSSLLLRPSLPPLPASPPLGAPSLISSHLRLVPLPPSFPLFPSRFTLAMRVATDCAL